MMGPEKIEIKAGQETLRGKLFSARQPKKIAVLFLHGWAGLPNEDAARVLAHNGYSSLTFSFSGHNDSSGELGNVSRAGSLGEAVAAYDYFKNHLPHGTKMAAAGSSYGSYMTALLSGRRELVGMSLRAPANYPDEKFEEPQLPQAPTPSNQFLNKWRKQELNYDATSSLRSVHNFSGYIQLLEAEKDDIVPPQTVDNYRKAVAAESKLDYHFMKDWTHGIGLDKAKNKQYQKVLIDWLNKISEQI